MHVYYHSAGAETKYTGSFQVGYFQGSAGSHDIQTKITVTKTESITNQSVTGIVTTTPGAYAVVFDLAATQPGTTTDGRRIRDRIPVVVR